MRAALLLVLLAAAMPLAAAVRLSRRAAIALGSTALSPRPVLATEQELGDTMAVVAAARQLDAALAQWDTEIALIQLGRQGALHTSANMLQEDALKRLGAGSAGASFTKHKNAMLTYLFLVTGATKYEGAAKAAAYANDAKKEALAARAALDDVARSVGVELPTANGGDSAR